MIVPKLIYLFLIPLALLIPQHQPRETQESIRITYFLVFLLALKDPYSRDPNPSDFVVPACHFIDFSQVLEFLILRLLAFLNLRHHTLVLLSNGGTCCLKALPLTLQLAYSLGLINCILGTNVIVL